MKKNRVDATIAKLKELNYYVKVEKCQIFQNIKFADIKNEKDLEIYKFPSNAYDVIILTEANYDQIIFFNSFCRKNNI